MPAFRDKVIEESLRCGFSYGEAVEQERRMRVAVRKQAQRRRREAVDAADKVADLPYGAIATNHPLLTSMVSYLASPITDLDIPF